METGNQYHVDKETLEIKSEAEVELKSYTCAMHPEITSDHPGKCSICGMELIEKNQ